MTVMFRMVTTSRSLANPRILFWAYSKFSSRASTRMLVKETESMDLPSVNNQKEESFGNYNNRLHLSPLFSGRSKHHMKDCRIELVDNESWQVSSGLAEVWKGNTEVGCEKKALFCDEDEDRCIGVENCVPPKKDPDFDEIEDMRIRGNLFYKLDKDSKEYEEYKFDFHRKKSPKNKNDQKETPKRKEKQGCRSVASGIGKDSKKKDELEKFKKKEKLGCNYGFAEEGFGGFDKNMDLISGFQELGADFAGKKLRTPTFNQLTAPYHEPFCLDIYVSKGSVRASIIHRATSKVVAVAHSISKDMKFDLGSTKSRSTCAAIGEVLAQRALADDIHNVVYTPRKGEKLEGKLQIVLQSIIDHGVDVKVKLKQRKVRKGGVFQPKTQE